MTPIEKLKRLEDGLAALTQPLRPKMKLAIEDQVRVDGLLYQVGETVRKLLSENGLRDNWAPECTLASPSAPLMNADKATGIANELSSKLYNALLDVRHALCWDGIPPTDQITDEKRAAIWAEMNFN